MRDRAQLFQKLQPLDVLQERTAIPENEWRDERKRLLSERCALVEVYYNLNDEIKNTEALMERNDLKVSTKSGYS